MSSLKTEAIILKGFKYGDSSKIITLFSQDIGKFTAIVKGVRNSKSKNSGVFENMNLVNVLFNKKDNRDLQIISNADCLSSFPKVKENFEKLLVAYKLLELTSKMMYEYDVSKEVFVLLKNVMINLDLADSNFEILYLLFQIKFAFIQGISPINDNSRNFLQNNFVLNDKDMITSKRLYLDEKLNIKITELLETEIRDFKKITVDKETFTKVQNTYDFHFMINSGKYGYSKNKQIIDELNKDNKFM